ncbi:flagellar protein FlaG [Halioxenophilus sp. WMMB6]|uniref:flagellar protein FlaG n=1 Tax=Halioxenophilus sp. WMMB6 TaxID=3073815 RepID=UPI00295E3B34|nr:flagellar protein FlaG [Halioxenophilus sp. WMMB6]
MDINNAVNIRPTAVTANPASAAHDVKGAQIAQVTATQAVAKPAVAEQRDLEPKEIETVVANLNEFAQSIRRDLSFSLQNETGQVIVEVTDSETGELIRKIPSEEALRLSERIAEVRSLMTSVEA